ncbi:MAG TPA: acyltransferase [Thermoplasmata archaeon]|nr:acyltransferase [Thermoplasmata archaeon]
MGTRIHPTAEVSPQAFVGDGTSIWHWAQVREGARIGARCNVGKDVYIDKDVVVGDDCKIQNFATLYRGLTVGDRVFIGPHACFTNDTYPRAVSRDWQVIPTKVEDGASIGANATILCGLSIGRHAMVAAGAVVTKDVPAHALVAGVPAKVVGWVCECGRPLDRAMRCARDGRTYPELRPRRARPAKPRSARRRP